MGAFKDVSLLHKITFFGMLITCILQFFGVCSGQWAFGKDDAGRAIEFGLWSVCYDYKLFLNGTENCEIIEKVLSIGDTIRAIRAMEIIELILFFFAILSVSGGVAFPDEKTPRRLTLVFCFLGVLFGIIGKSFFDGDIEYKESSGSSYVVAVVALVGGLIIGFLSICVCVEKE